MEINLWRQASEVYLNENGISLSENLPEIDVANLREAREIFDRAMCLHATSAVAHGFSSQKAANWLKDNDFWDKCTERELRFLSNSQQSNEEMRSRVEALWALFWVLGNTSELIPLSYCSQSFVTILPDLRIPENPQKWYDSAVLRDFESVASNFDIYYCLNWALHESLSTHNNNPFLSDFDFVITQRRHALEWVFETEDWEHISLDT